MMRTVPVEQHAIEIAQNREAWLRKPRLQAVYREFYRAIGRRIDRRIPGLIVEIGSGIGAIKDVIPECVTTDLFENPWLDRQENAYRLSFERESVSHLILFDVWHHLRYPGTALREFRRVLAPGGLLILFEPAASWTGRVVYGLFHHEPLGLDRGITWEAPNDFSAGDADYYAAQGSATRLFWWNQADGSKLDGWRVREVAPLVSFAYFAAGGFSGRDRGGRFVEWAVRHVDRIASSWPRLFAARLLVVLEKAGD